VHNQQQHSEQTSDTSERYRDGKRPSISGGVAGSRGFVGWTVEEEARLIDAVISYGEGHWAAVAALVSGRSELQCCKKWQQIAASVPSKQYCDGKRYSISTSGPGSRGFVGWTVEEETRLIKAVITYGKGNWAAVAALVSDRSELQCCKKWQQIASSVASQQHQQNSVPVATTATATPSFPSVHRYPIPVVFSTFQQHPTAMYSFPPMYHHPNIAYGSPALMQQGGPAGNVIHQHGSGPLQYRNYSTHPPASVQSYNPGLVAFSTDPQAPNPGPVEERARKRRKF
jgi:hypothetical protein